MHRFLISSVDLLGRQVSINLSGKPKLKSFFGGICSLIIYGFIIWITYNASRDLFTKNNPKVINYETMVENPREMIISSDIFPVGIAIQGPGAIGYPFYYDESIFKIDFIYTHYERVYNPDGTSSDNFTIIPLKTEICTPEYFGELASSYTIQLNTSVCISRDQPDLDSHKIRIRGNYDSGVYDFVNIKVSQCINATSKIPCASQEVLDRYTTGGWFNVFHVNMVANPQNYSRPDLKFRDIYYTMTSTTNYKDIIMQLGYIDIETDDGWLIEEHRHQNFVKVNAINEDLILTPSIDKTLISFTIQVSRQENYYKRSYKKIQDVLAQVGGMAQAAFVIIFLVTSPYLQLKVHEPLINELFNLDLSGKKKNKIIKIEDTIKKIIRKSIYLHERNHFGLNLKKISGHLKSEFDGSLPQTFRITPQRSPQTDLGGSFATPKRKKSKQKVSSLDTLSPSPKDQTPIGFSPSVRDIDLGEILEEGHSQNKHSSFSETEIHAQKSPFMRIKLGNKVKANSKNVTLSSNNLIKTKGVDEDKQSSNDIQAKSVSAKLNAKVLKEPEVGNVEPSESFANMETDNNPFSKNKLRTEKNKEPKKSKEKEEQIMIVTDQDYKEKKASKQRNQIEITVWEYLCSFIYQTKHLKEKITLLSEGVKNIRARLDVINIMKKLREVDKLKALLLDADQLILFNNLPKPEIISNKLLIEKEMSCSHAYELLKKADFVEGQTLPEVVEKAYTSIVYKPKRTKIDHKLLEIFNEHITH